MSNDKRLPMLESLVPQKRSVCRCCDKRRQCPLVTVDLEDSRAVVMRVQNGRLECLHIYKDDADMLFKIGGA